MTKPSTLMWEAMLFLMRRPKSPSFCATHWSNFGSFSECCPKVWWLTAQKDWFLTSRRKLSFTLRLIFHCCVIKIKHNQWWQQKCQSFANKLTQDKFAKIAKNLLMAFWTQGIGVRETKKYQFAATNELPEIGKPSARRLGNSKQKFYSTNHPENIARKQKQTEPINNIEKQRYWTRKLPELSLW